MQPRRQEFELGIPFPGRILRPEEWTQSALKRLPSAGLLDWATLFGREAPVVVDLGCGNGRYLIGSAIQRPGCDHFGLDALPVVVRYATRRANQRGLANIRFAVGDALALLDNHVPAHSVAELHVYHPQPYRQREQINRRMLRPSFLALVHRALAADGTFFIQTDNPPYWHYLCQVLPAWFDFRPHDGPWPDAPRGRTRREIIALDRGLPVFRGTAHPRGQLDPQTVARQMGDLPQPNFDAAWGPRDADD